MLSKAIYKKAVAELVQFDNTDVVRTSGGCLSWSNENGAACSYGLTSTDSPNNPCGINSVMG